VQAKLRTGARKGALNANKDKSSAMTDKTDTGTDGYIAYTVAALGPESWFVDSNKGTSGYSFHSLAEAERFAIILAQRNTPSKVCILGSDGEIVTERIFEPAADAAP
jgi:hypothetical protein